MSDESQFSELIERYGNSTSRRIVRALALSTVDTPGTGSTSGTLEQVLRLTELIAVEDANTLALCLEAATARISDAAIQPLDRDQIRRIERFIIRCCDFVGEQACLVAIGVVDLLDKLLFFGDSLSSFASEHIKILRDWLSRFVSREVEGPFAEQARAILEEIPSAG